MISHIRICFCLRIKKKTLSDMYVGCMYVYVIVDTMCEGVMVRGHVFVPGVSKCYLVRATLWLQVISVY